jgi:hypothetical protein
MARVGVSGIAVSVFILILQAGHVAQANDTLANAKPGKVHAIKPAPELPPPQPYNWTGFYGGINVGAAWGSYDPTTATSADVYLFHPRDIAAVNAAGGQRIDPVGFAGGAQFGYNWQADRTVLGLEAEIDYLHLIGAANSGANFYRPAVPDFSAAASGSINSSSVPMPTPIGCSRCVRVSASPPIIGCSM